MLTVLLLDNTNYKSYVECCTKYLEPFLRISGKIFSTFYVIFVKRPRMF